MTAIIQIGNTDDKLPQKEWSRFVAALQMLMRPYATATHFSGGAACAEPWQNYCMVVELDQSPRTLSFLRADLADLALEFQQDSIALTLGATQFVLAAES